MMSIGCTCLAIFAACESPNPGGSASIPTSTRNEVSPLVERTIPGGKSLSEIFDWFNRIEPVGDVGLSFQLRRANEKHILMDTDRNSHGFEYFPLVKPVVIGSGEKKHIFVEGVGIDVSIDHELFPVEGCPWLSNAVHRIYVKRQEGHEFNRITDMDRYVISTDLKKAYYLEKAKEVDYPFPFVNAKPDLSEKELYDQEELQVLKEYIAECDAALVKAAGLIVPNKRYAVRDEAVYGIRYVMFGEDGRSWACAEYSPKDEEDDAQVILSKYNPGASVFSSVWLHSNGSLSPCEVVEGEKYHEHEDGAVALAFVREVLNRLKLTAADLPDIKLDGIFATPEATK